MIYLVIKRSRSQWNIEAWAKDYQVVSVHDSATVAQGICDKKNVTAKFFRFEVLRKRVQMDKVNNAKGSD